MGKKVINTEITQSSVKDVVKESGSTSLPKLADKVIFTPTPRQKKIKAAFWSRFQPGPFANPDNLTLNEVQQITKESSLKEWWNKNGFREWFMNREEAREKLEYLFMKALDVAEEIMEDPAAQASAKVNMIKVLAELANKFPSKAVERYADEDINRMDEKQIRGYLERKGVIIKEEHVIDLQAEESTEGNKDDGASEQD